MAINRKHRTSTNDEHDKSKPRCWLTYSSRITGSSGGHAVIADGYGYNSDTLYHHVNMGWGGKDNAWYNLPNINSSYNFNRVHTVVYNIYPQGSGEIISGKVTDEDGIPIDGATVSASGGFSTTTNEKGIYALTRLVSDANHTIEVTKTGYNFISKTIDVGLSNFNDRTNKFTVGNKWGVNFIETEAVVIADDIYEENDLFSDAYDLTNLKDTLIDGKQADDDWYKFYVDAQSTNIKIDLQYTHADGALRLVLFDSSNIRLARDTSSADNATINYNLPTPFYGEYFYVKINKSDVGNSYKLRWDENIVKDTMSMSAIYYLLN